MQELIETIRVAVASDATSEEKAAGASACRAILTALDTEPGKPLVFPGSTPVQAMPRVSIDQVLELMIGRLSVIVKDREENPALAAPASTAIPPAVPRLRVPIATTSALTTAVRPATDRPAPSKTARPANSGRPVSPRKP